MARTKIKDKEIQNWDEADLVIKEIGELALEKESLENEMNRKISDIKLEYSDKADPLKKRIKKLGKMLKSFVTVHRSDFPEGAKSRELNFGQVGFRKSTKLRIPSKIKDSIVKVLERRGMNDCVQIKKKVNRDVLKTYPEDVILELGATKKIKDDFWYEFDREKIQD